MIICILLLNLVLISRLQLLRASLKSITLFDIWKALNHSTIDSATERAASHLVLIKFADGIVQNPSMRELQGLNIDHVTSALKDAEGVYLKRLFSNSQSFWRSDAENYASIFRLFFDMLENSLENLPAITSSEVFQDLTSELLGNSGSLTAHMKSFSNSSAIIYLEML